MLNQSNTERNCINLQAMSILKDPHILAAAVEENRRILTPLWFELLEESGQDGSIQTEYAKELSELLPLINFWLIPLVYPAAAEEIHHKYCFLVEVLSAVGLPLNDKDMNPIAEKFITDISAKGGNRL